MLSINLKRKLLKNSRLYLILDADVCGYDRLFEIAKQAVESGVGIIQLRDKKGSARSILDFSQKILKFTKNRALYIVNDRLDLALASGADGVHLGQDDLSIEEARKQAGSQLIIGVSCQSLADAKGAQELKADYIGFGSVFKTLTKPERAAMDLNLLKKVYSSISIPVFAIGGITQKNLSLLNETQADRFAVCRAILKSRNVRREIENLQSTIALIAGK